jgi:hypothetical protein
MPIFPPSSEPPTIPIADRIRVGVLGLEARHQANGVVLNTPTEAGYPRFKLTKIGGLHSTADLEDSSGPRFGQIGERAYPTLLRGKTLTYEGLVQAMTLAELRGAGDALRWAFGDPRLPLEVRVLPHPDNPLGIPMSYRAKPMSLEVDDEVTFDSHAIPSPWQREFTLVLRQGDPRYYDLELREASDAASVDVDNPGSAPTDPTLIVAGPAGAGWTVAYSGRFLTFNAAIGDGETVTIDFANRDAVLDPAGTLLTGAVTVESTWWNEGVYGIDPRSSAPVTLEGAAGLTVRWRVAHF